MLLACLLLTSSMLDCRSAHCMIPALSGRAFIASNSCDRWTFDGIGRVR